MNAAPLTELVRKVTSSRVNLAAAVLAILIIFFGGYAATGYLVADGPDTGEPGDPVQITTFQDSGNPIETVDGKPVIRLFSTTWCPHCKWSGPTFDRVVKEYVDSGQILAYHWELDTKDNTLTPEVEAEVPQSEVDVFQEFNPRGSIPTFVFGGKYWRIGNGFERTGDLDAEEAEYRAVIEKLIAESS